MNTVDRLFEYENSDILDDLHYVFQECTLKTRIGEHKAGEKFGQITVDFSAGVIALYEKLEDMEPDFEYELLLTIGDEI